MFSKPETNESIVMVHETSLTYIYDYCLQYVFRYDTFNSFKAAVLQMLKNKNEKIYYN